jgi:hypothetical protein
MELTWRPNENLIEGELANTIPGIVTGWIRFFRRGRTPLTVTLLLEGDFHVDIRGKKIRMSNPDPRERNEELESCGSYMDGMEMIQEGDVGDITAGIPVNGKVPHLSYPYIEWFSKANGRVVLELDPSQIEIVEDNSHLFPPLTEAKKKEQSKKRRSAFAQFIKQMLEGLNEAEKNEDKGGEE